MTSTQTRIALALALSWAIPATAVADAPETTSPPKRVNTWAVVDEFKKTQLDEMHLENTTVRQAIGRLVDVGFRCGFVAGRYIPPEQRLIGNGEILPYVLCERKLLQGVTGYPVLTVSLNVDAWKKHDLPFDALIESLDTAVVTHAGASAISLPADDAGPSFSDRGTRHLERTYRSLPVKDVAVYDITRALLLQGFECGARQRGAINDFDMRAVATPTLSCSLLRPSKECRFAFVSVAVQADDAVAEPPAALLWNKSAKATEARWLCLE